MITNSTILLFLSFVVIYFISKYSFKLGLIDYPSKRKKHKKLATYTGGISISLLFIFIVYITDFDHKYYNYILVYSFIISLCGFLDDKYNLNVGSKLCLQSFPIIFLVFKDLKIISLGEYIFIGEIFLGSFSEIFTILCCLLLINAVNYLDGTDGLAGSLFISSNISIFIILFLNDKIIDFYFLIIIIPYIVFYLFNFSFFGLTKTFLGNSGSMLTGFVLSFNAILINIKYDIHPTIIIWILTIFVYDFLSTNFCRFLENEKIFRPGYDHLHFYLNKKVKNKHLLNFFFISTNISIPILAFYLFKMLNSLYMTIIYVVLFLIYLKLMLNIRKKNKFS